MSGHRKNHDVAGLNTRQQNQGAWLHAFWRKLRQRSGQSCNDLLPISHLGHLDLKNHRPLGVYEVAFDKIVGSGRHHDFDLKFQPRGKALDHRWTNIARARDRGITLPPPTLYKIGEAYFVVDGNHRISVARSRGEDTIEAYVIEIDASTLTTDPSCSRLGFARATDA